MNKILRYASYSIAVAVISGCSSKADHCGGNVYPDKAGVDALRFVEKAKVDSEEFCLESGAGCDFTVAKTNQGWSVAVTRTFAVDGKCASRVGDEKFYSYDNSGSLIRVIDGM
ncbi:hypothetical protein [Pseudoxanthomonas wuyuanensis]|uniref:hypothetical protein n=1 Tax=Pseudoxanthomonas wuyuanensis TaxID=1073196 RepID=UPI001143368E|nr:hypothetical protein [Pseudoxanthomonas wuyuanensis]